MRNEGRRINVRAWAVDVNTIQNMEARGSNPITSSEATVRSVQLALEALGIEFLNHARPGVRLSLPNERSRGNGRRAESQCENRPRQNREVH